jgi:uncharacterized protein
MKPSTELLVTIADSLLSDSPNAIQLQQQVESLFALPADNVIEVIYRAALESNARLFPPITHIELISTEACNLACKYCFEEEMLGPRRMSTDVAQAAVDLLIDYSREEPSVYISHFGGEPTLNFDLIYNVTEYAEERVAAVGKTVSFDMTTNGLLLTEETVDYCANHDIKVLLSIDGLEPSHDLYRVDKKGRGTFERAAHGLAILKRRQSWVGVKMTVMPVNVARLLEDVVGLYGLGVNQFVIGAATGVEWLSESIQSFGDELKRVYDWYQEHKGVNLRISDFDGNSGAVGYFGCRASRNSLAVSVNGDLSPCSKLLALDNRSILAKLGDVRHGITHIQNRLELVACDRLESKCEAQGIASEFLGGCFATNYCANGDLFEPSLLDHQLSTLKRTIKEDIPNVERAIK